MRMMDNLDSELVKAKEAYIRRLTVRAVGIWEQAGKPKQLQFSMLINYWRMTTVWSFPNACFSCLVFFGAPSSSFWFAEHSGDALCVAGLCVSSLLCLNPWTS
jgi:hypothetical protein